MTNPTLALKHVATAESQRCTGCASEFVPAEDSGSRLLSFRSADVSVSVLLCGGCHSKWSHGSALTLKGPLPT